MKNRIFLFGCEWHFFVAFQDAVVMIIFIKGTTAVLSLLKDDITTPTDFQCLLTLKEPVLG